jgi:protein tyrosine kinase modulator
LNTGQYRLTYGPADDGGEGQAEDTLAAFGAQAGMSVVQFITIGRAYWKQSVAIALTTIMLAAVGIKLLPKTYTATATLIVSRNSDPLAAQLTPDQIGNGNNVNNATTQMELMTSPIVLLPVVDKLGLTANKDFVDGFRGGSTSALRDYAERTLAKRVETDTGRGGELIYISASGRSPAEAVALANGVADVYMEEERQRLDAPATERAQRYSQDLVELRAKAEAAQQSLTDFRQQNHLTDLNEAAPDSETQALTALEAQLLDAQNRERALEARQAGQEDTADEALESQQISGLKTQLSTLREQQAQIETTLGPRHPEVLALQARISSTQNALDRAIGTLSANTATQLTRVRELESSLTRAVTNERAKVLKLRQLQDEGQKLELELESAQSVYKRALDGYDQIMFASVDHSTDVSLVSRAIPPIKSSKPNKLKLLLASAFAALLMSLALPMGYELLLNRRLRCRDDIERAFGIPVLAEFSAISAAVNRV